jgi:hypothetical protein
MKHQKENCDVFHRLTGKSWGLSITLNYGRAYIAEWKAEEAHDEGLISDLELRQVQEIAALLKRHKEEAKALRTKHAQEGEHE